MSNKQTPLLKTFRHDGGLAYYPCHQGYNGSTEFECLICLCPLAFLECPGDYKALSNRYGKMVKSCDGCHLLHEQPRIAWDLLQRWVEISPLWDESPQSADKLQRYTEAVNEVTKS